VILKCNRCPEDRHDAVAGEFVHRAPVALDDRRRKLDEFGMISRKVLRTDRGAISIERTVANSTVTCLNSAWVSNVLSGDPQASQNRAPARDASAPHVAHAIPVAVTRAPPRRSRNTYLAKHRTALAQVRVIDACC
jgi:hypothetical protein